ncbi:MAG: ABC transporter ATP-binding protein [Vampirovibrio sp.]|nr:ABC transporter ATP-binding protein [Vampirovibrio sp.]
MQGSASVEAGENDVIPAIRVENIRKRFDGIQALDDVSFTVPQNTVFCILGHNGAGKTTLLRILTTVTRPDFGSACIHEYCVQKKAIHVRHQIGVVSQENHFDKYLNIWENLMLHAQLHGMSTNQATDRITDLLHSVSLYHRRFAEADDLSGGMQRRLSLIRALIHRPTVLFLDEPTTGLDPVARLDIWNILEQFKQSATVVLTTHYLEEADRLSDHILIVDRGRVLVQDTPDGLKQKYTRAGRYDMILSHEADHDKSATVIGSIPGIHVEETSLGTNGMQFLLDVKDPENLTTLFQQISPRYLIRFEPLKTDLESIFMAIANSAKDTNPEGGPR